VPEVEAISVTGCSAAMSPFEKKEIATLTHSSSCFIEEVVDPLEDFVFLSTMVVHCLREEASAGSSGSVQSLLDFILGAYPDNITRLDLIVIERRCLVASPAIARVSFGGGNPNSGQPHID